MKCDYCGFENEEDAPFCRKCGVNLKHNERKTFKKDVEVLNKDFKVEKKRQSYPAPPEDSIKAKLMYKHDIHTGELRVAKTKCATLVVFCGFAGFGLLLCFFQGIAGIFVGIILGIFFH